MSAKRKARQLATRPNITSDAAVESPYLTAAEAVPYLKLRTLSSLYRLIDHEGLPFGRRGARVYIFDKRELDVWLKRHRQPVPARKASS